MAKSTTVTITDDIDGSTGASEIAFSYRGVAYTIDLGKKNATALDKLLKPYIDAATKVPSRSRNVPTGTRARRSAVKTSVPSDVGTIRAWATANGLAVNSRGRISQTVRDAYAAARK